MVLQATYLAVVPAALVLAAVVGVVSYRRMSLLRTVLMVLFAVYLLQLVNYTFLPFPLDPQTLAREREQQYLDNSFRLFATFQEMLDRSRQGYSGFGRNIVGNAVLLLPLALFLPLLFERFRSLKSVFLSLLGTSLFIETGQLAVSAMLGYTYKIFDVDDIWLNALGGLLGYALFLLVSEIRPDLTDRVLGRSEVPV